MDVRSLVGGALVTGLATSAMFGACAKGRTTAPPPAGSVAAPTAAMPSAALDADTLADKARAAQSCTDPLAVLVARPDGGVMFNNADTSADAGQPDRGAMVVSALDTQEARFRCCFDSWARAQQDHPAPEGEVMLQVLLAPDGRVADAGLDPARTSIQDALTSACVVQVAADTKFPPSPRKNETLVEYPLRAQSSSRPAGHESSNK